MIELVRDEQTKSDIEALPSHDDDHEIKVADDGEPFGSWAVYTKQEGQKDFFVGQIDMAHPIDIRILNQDTLETIQVHTSELCFYFVTGDDSQTGKGYGTESVKSLMSNVFEPLIKSPEVTLDGICPYTEDMYVNYPSLGSLIKSGFKILYRGTLSPGFTMIYTPREQYTLSDSVARNIREASRIYDEHCRPAGKTITDAHNLLADSLSDVHCPITFMLLVADLHKDGFYKGKTELEVVRKYKTEDELRKMLSFLKEHTDFSYVYLQNNGTFYYSFLAALDTQLGSS